MYKLIILSIFPILLFSQNIVYSLQVATFSDYEKARKYQRKVSRTVNNLFLYKTDSGYWTVRYGKENRRKDIVNLKKRSKSKLLKNSIPVPTSLKKIRNIQIIRTKKMLSEKDLLFNKDYQKMVNSQNIEIKTENISKIIKNVDGSFFVKNISEIQKEYKKIDTYTFNLKIGERIYIVQFGKYPYSKKANMIFNAKPKNSDINSVTLSNSVILFSVKLNRFKKSPAEIEKILLPILNSGRRNRNIRVKAYRLKN